jgi:FMN-dependent NADH-azoreductase
MHILNIVTSPRKDQSASRALVDAFLRKYMTQADDIVVYTLDVWLEWLPEFDAETINAKYTAIILRQTFRLFGGVRTTRHCSA